MLTEAFKLYFKPVESSAVSLWTYLRQSTDPTTQWQAWQVSGSLVVDREVRGRVIYWVQTSLLLHQPLWYTHNNRMIYMMSSPCPRYWSHNTWLGFTSSRNVRPWGLASVLRPILLASTSALVSGCLSSVLALASIIWPRPLVERGRGQDLWGVRLFQSSITLSIFWIAVGIGNSDDLRHLGSIEGNAEKVIHCKATVASLWSHCSQDCYAYLQAQLL